MDSGFVYPPRALPGISDNWGRTVESRIQSGERSEQQLSQTVNNGLRAQGGQLAVIADQVEDLSNRRTHVAYPGPLSQTNNVTINPTFSNLTFSLPAPNVARSAFVGFSGVLSNSGGVANSVRAFVQLSYGGVPLARGDYAVPRSTSAPAGWEETPNLFFFTHVPAGADPIFTVSLSRLGFTATSTTLTLDNMTAYIQYGDAI